jgi:excisionase family DNA binding protein
MKNEKLFYTRKETAQMLRISEVTLWRLVTRGELQPKRIGSRQLFTREQLEKFAGVSA